MFDGSARVVLGIRDDDDLGSWLPFRYCRQYSLSISTYICIYIDICLRVDARGLLNIWEIQFGFLMCSKAVNVYYIYAITR